MRAIVHDELGEAASVLDVRDIPPPPLGGEQVRIRVRLAPIHRGDLLGVEGSPAFGTPPSIPPGGRVPGFEGTGEIIEVGAAVAELSGLKKGARVAFYPARAAWAEEVIASATSTVPLPDTIPDEIAAQMLINIVTALTVLRTGHEALPESAREQVIVIQTAAGSAVGRLLSALLVGHGVDTVRLVRSQRSAASLSEFLPTAPVFATEDEGWKSEARAALAGRKAYVAFDGVGGPLLNDIADLLADGGGTVVNYGSLGGAGTDIRLFPPRSLTLKGVSLGSWSAVSEAQRKEDIELALRFAAANDGRYAVAGVYDLKQIREAIAAVDTPGKVGTVLLRF